MKKNNSHSLNQHFRSFGLEAARLSPLQVTVENGNFEDAFRRFKALAQKERIVGQFKERQFYEKPSEKKRRKQRQSRERNLMLEARERMMRSGEWDKIQKRKADKRLQKVEKKREGGDIEG